jgi:hypothetical protein
MLFDCNWEVPPMAGQRRFRILTPDGALSHDTFVLPANQPRNIPVGCVRVIHEQSGTMLTVHDSRLFPAGATGVAPFVQRSTSACLKCGRVTGVAEDQVACPNSGDGSCGILHPRDTPIDVPSSSPP